MIFEKLVALDIIVISANAVVLAGGLRLLWKIFKSVQFNNESIKAMQRAHMVGIYDTYKKKKKIPRFTKLVFSDLYGHYKNLKGNSYIDQISKEINKMPEEK